MRRILPLMLAAVVLLGYGLIRWFDQSLARRGVPMEAKVTKTDEQWRELLTSEQFQVARRKGTERAFAGAYWDTKSPGVYHCVCCGLPLFDASTKFDSGTGWPSFWQPVEENHVSLHADHSWFMKRTEATCSRCDAHLGHLFNDGPAPTGLRYCINSASLNLVANADKDDPLSR